MHALHHLGLIAHIARQDDAAEELIRRAIALGPNIADLQNSLGIVLKNRGRRDEAIAAYRRAIAIRPDYPDAHNNLGIALREKGELVEAIAEYRRAVALRPNYPEALNNLGNALREHQEFEAAIASYEQAIALRPGYSEALSNLGVALRDAGRLDQALAAYQQAISLRPDFAEAYNNLGIVLKDMGKLNESITAFRQAISLKPNFAELHHNLANALNDDGQIDAAIAAYREAIALGKNQPQAHYNLGVALGTKGDLDEAVSAYRQAIAIKPDFALAWNNLGSALKDKSDLEAAIAAYQKAVEIAPKDAAVASNLLYALLFDPAYDAVAIAEEHRRWNQRHAEPRAFSPGRSSGHFNDRNPDRPLRIGYVSPDFRNHVVGRNLLPLLRAHDRAQFKIYCYSSVIRPDATTSEIEQIVDVWRNIAGIPDEAAARQIRDDGIDLLVDLTLHMSGNRLLIFAGKPAPVQLTYLGYCGSTGMSAIDFRFSDPQLDPPETDLSIYSEKTVRLPRSYWCYQPTGEFDITPPPARENGYITFGCLNNIAKISQPARDLWATILNAVPGSRLILHAPAGNHLTEIVLRMQKAGVSGDRLQFIGNQTFGAYMQTYGRIDIALDPFPYAGGITTCDALWMGVPVVTLSGKTAVGRGGRTILSNVGAEELIAMTAEQYRQIATDLARNVDMLEIYRQELRPRMLASPLMNAGDFARDVESAYRSMWREWCEAHS